jgi:hypothetical protein
MPFTPAHPAIILPFLRSRYFSATALVAGSVTPDFEYFFKMGVNSFHSHTLAGLIYFDVPVAVLLSFVFHLVVKRNLIMNLPVFLQRRFADTLQLNFIHYVKNNLAIFLISALAGSASHLFWDSFTHDNGFFARELPFYEGTYVPFEGARYPLFYALQHISTFVGLVIVALYIVARKPAGVWEPVRPHPSYWALLTALATVIVWARFMIRPEDYNIGNLVVSIITGLLVALVICGFINFRQHGQKITMGTGR